jgi:hypothetical protein
MKGGGGSGQGKGANFSAVHGVDLMQKTGLLTAEKEGARTVGLKLHPNPQRAEGVIAEGSPADRNRVGRNALRKGQQ